MTDKTYLGNACRHGHDGTRYKSNNICVSCHKGYAHIFQKWREDNKELLREKGKAWYEKNKDRKRAIQKIWNDNNPDKRRIHAQNRKSRVGELKITYQDVQKIFALQRGCCAICKISLDSYEIDHVMPLSLGGKHEPTNIQILCQNCNRTKHMKDPVDFMQSKGYLL